MKREEVDAKFAAFDAAHPDVYGLFRKFAEELLARGFKRHSARAILHRIRWETSINPERDGGFKVSNYFANRYAHKLVAEDDRFEGFFEFREPKEEAHEAVGPFRETLFA